MNLFPSLQTAAFLLASAGDFLRFPQWLSMALEKPLLCAVQVQKVITKPIWFSSFQSKMGNIRRDQTLWCSASIPLQQKQRNDLWCTLSTLALNGLRMTNSDLLWATPAKVQVLWLSSFQSLHRFAVPCVNKRLVFFQPSLYLNGQRKKNYRISGKCNLICTHYFSSLLTSFIQL